MGTAQTGTLWPIVSHRMPIKWEMFDAPPARCGALETELRRGGLGKILKKGPAARFLGRSETGG
jgi:hypothetical protein